MAVFNRQNKAGTIGYAKFDMDNSQYRILDKPTLLSEQRTCTNVQLKSYLPDQRTKEEKKKKEKISQFEMHFKQAVLIFVTIVTLTQLVHC